MINITTLLTILFAHWVADFVMQTDYMAQNKSSSNKALLRHTVIYSCWMFLIVGMLGAFNGSLSVIPALSWVLSNFALHTVTDYVTSRMSKRLWAEKKVHEFFVVIGFDQFLHYAALLLTWKHFFGV